MSWFRSTLNAVVPPTSALSDRPDAGMSPSRTRWSRSSAARDSGASFPTTVSRTTRGDHGHHTRVGLEALHQRLDLRSRVVAGNGGSLGRVDQDLHRAGHPG